MRLQKIDVRNYTWLAPDDNCFYYGDYTSGGGFNASDTNRQIINLKKKPSASQGELYYKGRAINYWGDTLKALLTLQDTQAGFTFVPMPGSKPVGHHEYDDRMHKVLARMCSGVRGVDVRPLLKQTNVRIAQHESSSRLTPSELGQTLAVDNSYINTGLPATIIVVDDVITMGASFAAAKSKLLPLAGVEKVAGIFLARTVWPQPSFDDES